MHSLESTIHSFIVKIWIEEVVMEDGEVVWRGHITHVPSKEREYFSKLAEISDFIIPYLEAMGIKLETDQQADS